MIVNSATEDMNMTFKKKDEVIWRVTSGNVTQEFQGVVTATCRNQCCVLFDGGGHWLDQGELLPGRNIKVLAVIATAIGTQQSPVMAPAQAVYDALFNKGLLRLDALAAR